MTDLTTYLKKVEMRYKLSHPEFFYPDLILCDIPNLLAIVKIQAEALNAVSRYLVGAKESTALLIQENCKEAQVAVEKFVRGE